MTKRVRILTYNIHKCRGLDRRVHPRRIVEVLREVDADIVALQEVLSVQGHPAEDQAQFIAAQLGFHSCLGENRRLNGGAYGNLLLSRFPLRAIQNHDISTEGREPRGCLRADIELAETTVHVFNVHLGTSFFERRQQGRKLVSSEILGDQDLHGARVILGDFNEWTQGLTSDLLGRHFESVDIRAISGVRGHTRAYFLSFIWITSISILALGWKPWRFTEVGLPSSLPTICRWLQNFNWMLLPLLGTSGSPRPKPYKVVRNRDNCN